MSHSIDGRTVGTVNPLLANFLSRLTQNKYTTICGILLGICVLGEIWVPSRREQFGATEKALMIIGLALAGDGKPKDQKTTNEP